MFINALYEKGGVNEGYVTPLLAQEKCCSTWKFLLLYLKTYVSLAEHELYITEKKTGTSK